MTDIQEAVRAFLNLPPTEQFCIMRNYDFECTWNTNLVVQRVHFMQFLRDGGMAEIFINDMLER